MRVPACPAVEPARGFTLVELIVVIAIIAVLASIAIPQYLDHVRRARLTEAVARLADYRVRLEQYYLDNRRYDDDAGQCGYVAPTAAADAFTIGCVVVGATYTVTATGIAAKGMLGYTYTIDQANTRRTPSVPPGWVPSDNCWVVRRDGSCG